MFTVYILYSKRFDKYYIGQTADIEQRLLAHNAGEKYRYTTKYRPWALAASVEVPSRSIAMRVERFIKKQKSKVFIKKLVAEAAIFSEIVEKCSSLIPSATSSSTSYSPAYDNNTMY